MSGDEHGNIILWIPEDEQGDRFAYRKQWSKKSHEGSVSSLGVYTDREDASTGLIMSGGNDGVVHVYRWKGHGVQIEVQELQSLKMGGRMPLDLAVTNLPDSRGTSRQDDVETPQSV